jgi:Mg2+/Co2+ transporter CorB
MIPASDCARVAEDRTIHDAVIMLEAWRQRSQSAYRPRVVLVHDKDYRIIGSLRHVDMLRALASGRIVPAGTYLSAAVAREATTPSSFSEQAALWSEVLAHLQEAAQRIRVRDAMYHYQGAEYIDENASMEEVLSRLLSGPYLNLVVTSAGTTLGVVRLSDLFDTVCTEIKRSGMK